MFVANEDNHCMRNLLTIVARGSAIVTELYRLIELVPTPFKYNLSAKNSATTSASHQTDQLGQEKIIGFDINDIVFDFRYFKDTDKFEATIDGNPTLKKADEDFCDNFIDILTRFYLTFESIHRYAQDLNNFVQELNSDTFVTHSVDSLLQDNDGRQLLCEAYFLLGYMLLTVDNNFEGGLRERLIVSYYRYSAYRSSPDSSLDETCNLLRSTSYRCPQQQVSFACSDPRFYHRPQNYPESFFQRASVNQSVVNLLIAKLQSVDIYNQTLYAFPDPDHRSTALAQQASMLYVILYFCPNILISQRSKMREITDKFFYDNWIISIYMGELVNMIEAWEPYRAARDSLIQLHDAESVTGSVRQFCQQFERVSKQTKEYLKEGWLDFDSVLEHHTKILNHIRNANVILRWMLLQSRMFPCWRSKLSKSLNSIVIKSIPGQDMLYKFLQDLAELERKFSRIYSQLINGKDLNNKNNKKKAKETLDELVEIYTDEKPMRWIQPGSNTKLVALLKQFAQSMEEVQFEQQNAKDFTVNMINQIDLAQESYSDGKNLQVVQLFNDTKTSLLQILKTLSLSDDISIILHSISDFSYCWKIMDEVFTAEMQKIIKADPLNVHRIESTFLKLASAFEANLIRIQQVKSQTDLISVSQYYSTKLVSYIRDVLHVIPETILELLSSIINIQTEYIMKDLPSKISLDHLKDYALSERRYQMMELTFNVSHFAECMSLMQDTTIGLIRINSKQLLEDGIRRELVRRMSNSIQNVLSFDEDYATFNNSQLTFKQFSTKLIMKLNTLSVIMNGYKNSFEYIQDYLFIYGLRMWQEELNRIVKFNIEQPIEIILNRSIIQTYGQSSSDYKSSYQSTKAPIPIYSSDPLRSSFMVRLLNEVLRITNPRLTIYDEQMSAWFEQKAPHEKILDSKIFEIIASSLSITGLNGFDQLCCAVLALEIQKLDNLLISLATESKEVSSTSQVLVESLQSIRKLNNERNLNTQTIGKIYSTGLAKVTPHSDKIINHLLSIGQLQAIRISISCVLSSTCRYEAKNLYGCLETLNTSLLSTLGHGRRISQHKKDLTEQHEQQRRVGSQLRKEMVGDEKTTSNESNDNNNHDDDDGGGCIGEDIDSNIEDSQLIFELTNHLEWIGLSDPITKIYTLAMQTSQNSQVHEFRENLLAIEILFLVLLEQCSKFNFSPIINGFITKQSKSFYETAHNVDAQPLFYGLVTFLNHYQPYLPIDKSSASSINEFTPNTTTAATTTTTTTTNTTTNTTIPIDTTNLNTTSFVANHSKQLPLTQLLEQMSLYVKCTFDQTSTSNQTFGLKQQDVTAETVNMILSMLELIRLTKESSKELLKDTFLPKFVFDTFQFTANHFTTTSGNNYDSNHN